MAIRQICLIGDDVLRKKSRAVDAVDDRTRALLDDLADTLRATENGAGLAAPQVGVLRRLVVVDHEGNLFKLVNPEIIDSEGEIEGTEGCLSIPGRSGIVRRPAQVTIRALDENGEPFELRAEGPFARCLCHEIDHLDGILYIDKAIEMYGD